MPATSVYRAAAALLIGVAPAMPALAEAPADAGVAETTGLSAASPLLAPDRPTVAPALTDAHDAVRTFYAQRLDAPVWHDASGWTPAADAALKLLQDAHRHGLRPADYLPAEGAALIQAPPTDRADVALTRGVLHYLRDVTGGRIPAAQRPGHRYPHGMPDAPQAAAALLVEALAAPDTAAALAGMMPDHPQYPRLVRALADLRQLRDATGGWPHVPAGQTLREGDVDHRVPLLRAALVLHGDLDPAAASTGETLYDATLAGAVERFQRRHGIAVDGVLGPDTLRTLNVPVGQRIDQIIANLERLRWDPAPPVTGKFVEVNVPDYTLTAYDNGEPALSMKVVVGTEKNKTPLFTDYMDDVVLNPTWTVPRSIAAEEILPQLRADPGYVFGENMQVYSSWSRSAGVVDPFEVDWWAVNGRTMPYRFVERSGPGNALGVVRFSLNNDFAIYMHDTPAKRLFSRPHRSFSHGCIRVEDYDRLLQFVAGPAYESIRAKLDTGRTMTIQLPEPVDVRVTYRTVWRDDTGRLHVRRDVYGNDTEVLQRLQEEGRQLIALKPQDPQD
ncbi:murein L,D-transpeptidase [Caenispirillum salinarum]|uniref:L,D-transpeptidase family protein n=1 Tax=Caenispirillum salinarum TaxID=859058 RepID=UPI00384CABD9